MLMVAPTGRTNLVTRLSIPRFSSRQRKVTGKVPALEAVPRAVIQAWKMPAKKGERVFPGDYKVNQGEKDAPMDDEARQPCD